MYGNRMNIMKEAMKRFSVFFLASAFIVFFVSDVYSQQSSEKAKQILEKNFQKYSDLFNEGGKGLKSIGAKLSIKGSGNMNMGKSTGEMPMEVNANVELYVTQPNSFFLGITGNLGNIQIIISGEKALTASLVLPSTKQFATIPIQENTLKEKIPIQEDKRENLWKNVILTYSGIQNTKMGKAHKINIKSVKPAEKGSINYYVLDNVWDPARLELLDPDGAITIEFEKLQLNANIPKDRFIPDTKGYTQITQQQLTSVLMMQMMASTMQKSQTPKN